MKLIAITTERFFNGETEGATALFERGLERLHLRKPEASAAETAEWLTAIPETFHSRIVLHDHFELANRFNLGGIHLNRRNPSPVGQPKSISRSCHTLVEIKEHSGADYYFLSPAFDSISKPGYRQGFELDEAAEAFAQRTVTANVYALGGITPERLLLVKQAGFAGAAVLGALWETYPANNNIEALIERLRSFKNKL